MNLTLSLTPAEEANLLAKARIEGTTPERLVRQAINPILRSGPGELVMNATEADIAFEGLLDTLPSMPELSDKVLSRESIYAPEGDSL